MSKTNYILSDIKLTQASPELIASTAATALNLDPSVGTQLTVKDISGNSGAQTYVCLKDQIPQCIVKVVSGGGIMDSHPNTHARVKEAAEAMRTHGIAPPDSHEGT